MNPRAVLAPLALAAVLLVTYAGGSSPAAHPDGTLGTLDLLASAHPTSAEPAVTDVAFDHARAKGRNFKADTAALTSTSCNGCSGESTALHVVYGRHTSLARLDNVANAWAQQCQGCTSTALSVQVVVVRGRPSAVPNNRALSLTAACDSCRTSALAFQVVLVADDATPLSDEALAELQAWFAEQAAVLRASVLGAQPTRSPEPTPDATESVIPSPSPTGPQHTAPTRPTDGVSTVGPQMTPQGGIRRARRDAVSALAELQALLARDLGGEAVSADVDLSR